VGGATRLLRRAGHQEGTSGEWFAWSTIAVVIIDNFIKPVAMRHGTELPTIALFFGLAGGIDAFGPLGIFLGPAIIAVFAALLRVYRRTYVRDQAPEMDGQ
jgi:predicted PurR-regulated permease PerM